MFSILIREMKEKIWIWWMTHKDKTDYVFHPMTNIPPPLLGKVEGCKIYIPLEYEVMELRSNYCLLWPWFKLIILILDYSMLGEHVWDGQCLFNHCFTLVVWSYWSSCHPGQTRQSCQNSRSFQTIASNWGKIQISCQIMCMKFFF